MDKNEKLDYLDSTRGVALLGGIIGHIFDNCTWIYSFHVPVFFIISGYLLYYKDTLNKTLLI